ncbi:alpha/beta fold hydrolase [Neptunomonas phycophila]|uniref:alpha/beta fold hydrolase n=1 Tax=Neptunomonas phycophila TaxID=1572645 RepID=UPI0015BF2602|nr:alpha/beta hydrolase [Neptunomonas phycophila]QLE98625.1 alpha/beta hydrolase [Neptunomonas phycophila]
MRTDYVLGLSTAGYHKMAYREWGHLDNERVLVCVHGLARNGRDFDDIAKALSRHYRVICPDIVGRGESDWLKDPTGYTFAQYLSDIMSLLARLNVKEVDWLGTSMGGLLGIMLAAYPNSPIKRLILNDVGPFVSKEALKRIGEYLKPSWYESVADAKAAMQANYPALRYIREEQWQHLVRYGYRLDSKGWTQHYDPAIGDMARANSSEDVDLWPFWQGIQCPQLLIWGEASDVLRRDTVEQMQQLNPALSLYALPDIEHVPSLMEEEHIETITTWLRNN